MPPDSGEWSIDGDREERDASWCGLRGEGSEENVWAENKGDQTRRSVRLFSQQYAIMFPFRHIDTETTGVLNREREGGIVYNNNSRR